MNHIQIRDFVKPELDRFRELCNFTDDELTCFNFKAKNMTNVQISIEMCVSEAQVDKLVRRVKNNIIKVL